MRVARAMGDGEGDEGGGQRRGNVDGGKSDGDGSNGGRRAMVMATKRVMVTATRVGEVGGRRNGQWRWRDSNKENYAIWSKMVRLDPTMMVSTQPKWHRP